MNTINILLQVSLQTQAWVVIVFGLLLGLAMAILFFGWAFFPGKKSSFDDVDRIEITIRETRGDAAPWQFSPQSSAPDHPVPCQQSPCPRGKVV